MAHFAKLDENNVVVDILRINNEDILDAEGNESEAIGIQRCTEIVGEGTWLQTNYQGSSRKNYAGIGYIYDAIRDAFISPSPYPSWVLNEDTCRYEAPIPYPSEEERGLVGKLWNENGSASKDYYRTMQWDEAAQSWVADEIPPEIILF